MTAEEIIKRLHLVPLPEEGGYYRQTFKSDGILAHLPNHKGPRSFSTAIYYLVTPEEFSALHRVPQVEMFHFYLGDPVEMIQITESGHLTRLVIGTDLAVGHEPQVTVAPNVWQGTRLLAGGKFALMGCTVTPGFEFADFEIQTRDELTRRFPTHAKMIERFTRA